MVGYSCEINPSWFSRYVTKTLINVRHGLNKLIDAGERRPLDVHPDVWNRLEGNRKSKSSKEKSEHMRNITKGKATKEAQLRVIEKDVIGELVRSTFTCQFYSY